jgi:hypothetical protein
MSVQIYCWQVGDAWLATCPSLESGGRGDTRDEALRRLHSEISEELRMVFNEGIQIIDSPPPAKDEK